LRGKSEKFYPRKGGLTAVGEEELPIEGDRNQRVKLFGSHDKLSDV